MVHVKGMKQRNARFEPWAHLLSIICPFHDRLYDLGKNWGYDDSNWVHFGISQKRLNTGVCPSESGWRPSGSGMPDFVANEKLYQLSYDPNQLSLNHLRGFIR